MTDGAINAEYEDRLGRVQEAMARKTFGALVVCDPANLFYLTGYNAWSFYTPQCLLVPAEGSPHLFARAQDAAGAAYTCNLPDDRIHGYPEELVHRPDVHPFDWISATIRTLVPAGELVGVECDAHFFSPRAHFALHRSLPAHRLVDSAELVNWVRVIKSPHEVQQLRIAGTITERAMRTACENVRPGRRQCDVVAEIMAAQATGTPEHGGDYPAIVPMLPTGDAAGAPPHQLTETAKVIAEAMDATLAAIRPGVDGDAVHKAFDRVIRSHGMEKGSRLGYPIGIGYPPDWGERTISLRPGETTELAAGMALHIIPGMWTNGFGYEMSEPVVVTDTGVERLTDLPQELTVWR